MNAQLSIDFPPWVRRSVTSFDAAASIASKTDNLRKMILDGLKTIGPMTDEEIADLYRLNPSTARPRRVELCERGQVRESGIRRKTRSGRSAAVWEAF